MAQIFETENFIVRSANHPHVSREEGGHILIKVKDESISDRTKLTPQLAIELMRLSMIVGEAFAKGMQNRGVEIVKVNYQDMGNWPYKEGKQPVCHYNIYGRVWGAKKQPFPEAVYLPDMKSGFYDGFAPLTDEDCQEISRQIEMISATEKYQLKNWE